MSVKMNTLLYTSIMVMVLQGSKCAEPFSNPRKGFGFRTGGSAPVLKYRVHYPSLSNIQKNKVVLINGYRLGTSMMALSTTGTRGRPNYPQNDMKAGDFYTNAYRWALRAISLLPEWVGGANSVYPDSHKVWLKRYHYMDNQVPQWLRSLLFYVEDWDEDKELMNRYNLYTKPSFDKHLRFPSKATPEKITFASFRQTEETVENLDDSEAETPAPRSLEWGPWVWDPYDEYRDTFWGRLWGNG